MYTAYYAQVLSIGVIWVFFHCGGMCGPIIAGVTSSTPIKPGGGRWAHLRARAARVLAYQGGRSLTYAMLGAAAGAAGAVFETALRDFTQAAGLVLAVILIGLGIAKLPFVESAMPQFVSKVSQLTGTYLGKVLRLATRNGPKNGLARFVFMGALMGLLPCMLMFWVLSIATSTASPIHGAGVMLLLVLMTTPTLLAAGCAAALPGRKINGEKLVPWAMILSGAWLLLIAAAANGWIEHIHLQFELLGEGYVFMLW